ncbi:phosphatidylserine decarboxylase [Chrysiogenes arsenatis]|uniref:phosphatidylserine decarboxylase n=1 Tax=Chrysiogenes arsenatis TaxID=309797 RepID=UPI0003FC0891|nr:phosphatidylserine decarboxylase [Chrysiogenes arsenatis]
MKQPLWGIAREGYSLILIPLALGILASAFGYKVTSTALIATGLFCLFFFRDPERRGSFTAQQIVSPADGKVIAIKRHATHPVGQQAPESEKDQEWLQVCIFLNIFNVHVNRSPFAGKIVQYQYRPGRFHAADKDEAALENEHNLVAVQTDFGPLVYFKQIAGLVARRVVFWGKNGDRLEPGMRIGLMKFSSRMDLFLPVDTVLSVKEGDKVVAGKTVLGEFHA